MTLDEAKETVRLGEKGPRLTVAAGMLLEEVERLEYKYGKLQVGVQELRDLW